MLQIQTVHVAGIPVRIDASWLLVFELIAWSLDDGPESRVAEGGARCRRHPRAAVQPAWRRSSIRLRGSASDAGIASERTRRGRVTGRPSRAER